MRALIVNCGSVPPLASGLRTTNVMHTHAVMPFP